MLTDESPLRTVAVMTTLSASVGSVGLREMFSRMGPRSAVPDPFAFLGVGALKYRPSGEKVGRVLPVMVGSMKTSGLSREALRRWTARMLVPVTR